MGGGGGEGGEMWEVVVVEVEGRQDGGGGEMWEVDWYKCN